MESISELLNKISITNYESGSAYWVDVTHINNPHSFYVRPTMCRMHMPVLQACGDLLDKSEAQVGTTVIYKSKLLQSFVRGQIIFVEDNEDITCDVYALDNGCIEKTIALKNMYKPYNNFPVPSLVIHCQLADCKPIGETWSNKAIDAMKFYVGKERARMVIRDKTSDLLTVELINSCPDDIATLLALTGYTTLGYGDNSINRFIVPSQEQQYYTYKKLNVGDVLHVRVQSGKSLKGFYVSQIGDYKYYLNERENVTYYCKNQKQICPEDIVKGKPVGVLIDSRNKYERALVKDIMTENRAVVQLMDWGDTIEVKIDMLQTLSENFLMHPAAAIFCAADECQVWDNGLHKFLYPGFEFHITIKKLGDKFDLPNIIDISPLTTKK